MDWARVIVQKSLDNQLRARAVGQERRKLVEVFPVLVADRQHAQKLSGIRIIRVVQPEHRQALLIFRNLRLNPLVFAVSVFLDSVDLDYPGDIEVTGVEQETDH